MAAKFRNELKYICQEYQLRIIENDIRDVCCLDPHVNEEGIYVIRSLYFDDLWDTCYQENDTGVEPRAKYRIRVYDGSLDQIVLERKSKIYEMTHKDECSITYDEAMDMIHGLFRYYGDIPLMQQFFLDFSMYMLRPKVVVEYERTPYIYKDGNVRITLDRNVCASYNMDTFWQEDTGKRQVLPHGSQILEVKYDEFLPDFIKNLVQTDGLQQTSYSKYYNCRRLEKETEYGRIYRNA